MARAAYLPDRQEAVEAVEEAEEEALSEEAVAGQLIRAQKRTAHGPAWAHALPPPPPLMVGCCQAAT